MNEHHVIRKSHDATHKKNVPTWCISMYHVTGLKQTRGIKNVTLKAGKNSWVSKSTGKSNSFGIQLMRRHLVAFYEVAK